MQRSTVITAILAAGVAIALMTSIGTYTTLAESQSNIKRQNDEEMKSMMSRMSEKMDMMMDRMDTMLNGMDMLMAMLMGDMMGPMDDMMNQEPLDVIIKIKSSPKVQVGKEAEVMLLVLDKRTQEPMEGVQVLIGIERGSSMTSMEMMGDMFEAEDKGSGQYVVRFTPDNEGVYTIHTMVMLPGRSMMDNHMDFGIIAQTSDI
jgi:hypothetical protein